MPFAAKRPCAQPGCSALVVKGYCAEHARASRVYDKHRGTAAQRGYDAAWQRASKAYLRAHPIAKDIYCYHESELGGPQPAEVVDHIVPHRGDVKLFWDSANWQPLTKADHDRKTAEEDGGFGRARRG